LLGGSAAIEAAGLASPTGSDQGGAQLFSRQKAKKARDFGVARKPVEAKLGGFGPSQREKKIPPHGLSRGSGDNRTNSVRSEHEVFPVALRRPDLKDRVSSGFYHAVHNV
jgi:hypothetical protein